MNKYHLSYSITLTAYVKHKGACISKLYNETWGLQSNKVARRGDRRGHSQIHSMSPSAKVEKNSRGRPSIHLVGGDNAKSGIGNHERETSTQDTFGPDEQLCSMKEPTFECKVLRYDCL
ncbi:predicted protein [Lichtheimia corymbifera JMRC:FSU:9682]|uniref:Uncharacterized protein n=1 Tax=Lichtheimia corymbifera JMRC:FSU:9682 TaxID=1263082 RepID=A0A068S3G8_9FUNG|nr:predicted protein [Lichtheimia corymbifera JMRC:FSU:9682]